MLFLGPAPALAQTYLTHLQRYDTKQGLSHHVVRSLLQDQRGFIWAGTDQGLNRFDGYSFVTWTKAEHHLQYEHIDDLFEDTEGRIWIFYYQYNSPNNSLLGIDIFDPVTEKIVPWERFFAGKLPNPLPALTASYASSPDGALYMGLQSSAGVLCYHPRTGFSIVSLALTGIFTPEITGPNNTLIGHLNSSQKPEPWQLIICDLTTGKKIYDAGLYSSIRHPAQPRYTPDGQFLFDRYQIGTRQFQICHFSPENGEKPVYQAQRIAFEARPVRTWLLQGKLFVYNNAVYDTKTNKIVFDIKQAFPEISRNGAYTWLIDDHGHLWLGTALGLLMIDIQENIFQQLLFNGDPSTQGKGMRGILPLADGTVLANAENIGQFRIAPDGTEHQILAEYATALVRAPNGSRYTGSNFGRMMLNVETPRPQTLYWGSGSIWCFGFDDKNNQFLGTANQGLYIYDNINNQFSKFNKYNNFQELEKSSIYHIQPDGKGAMWVCAESGLYRMSAEAGILERYWSGGQGRYHFPGNYFLHLHIDKQGIIWLATHGNGLIRWDKDNQEVIQFHKKNGFPFDIIYAIYEDKHGFLWMSSDFGIIQFDIKNQKIKRIYSTREGITHQEFNRISHAQAADGTLYFGGLNGITAFNPNSFNQNKISKNTKLQIVNCMKYNANADSMVSVRAEILQTGQLELSASDRYFELDVALLSYSDGNLQYAWKLDDEIEWHYQKEPNLRFGGLAYGTHFLQIRAQGNDGLWAENEINITIIQIAPFYLRWWFILLSLLFVAAASVAFVRWRTLRLRARQQELEAQIAAATEHIVRQAAELRQLNTLKSRFFANVSHELRTPLTLILGPISSLLRQFKPQSEEYTQIQTAEIHARQLLKLVNEILDLSKMEAGKLEIRETTVSLQPFIYRLVSAFESHAQRLNIQLTFEYKAANRLRVLIDEDKISKIINNLISNALKFTDSEGKVSITVSDEEDYFSITVQDSGRGIHPNDLPHIFDRFYQSRQPDAPTEGGTGIGLSLCKELTVLLGGTISVQSTLGQGSTFVVRLPRREVLAEPEVLPEVAKSPVPIAASGSLLVVEDNPNLRSYVCQILRKSCTVAEAEHGKAALEYLQKADKLPDLIISDVMMPVMDGFQLLEILKTDSRYCQIPVVMLTARADMPDKLRALRIGVDDYLLKPFEEEELLARIHNLLNNDRRRREAKAEETPTATAPATARPALSQPDLVWLANFEQMVQQYLANPDCTTDELADAMAMSRSTLIRQVRRLTGLSPAQYLDEARFFHARSLLETRTVDTVKAAAYQSGFLQVEHFSRSFMQRFGKYPSAYLA